MAREAFPLVMGRARAVLRQFVEDDRLTGARPLARHQIAEVATILQQLRGLQLQPGVPLPEIEEENRPVSVDTSPQVSLDNKAGTHNSTFTYVI